MKLVSENLNNIPTGYVTLCEDEQKEFGVCDDHWVIARNEEETGNLVAALRFTLVLYTAQSDKINLDTMRVVGYRQWSNNRWNSFRFSMTKLVDDYTPPTKIIPCEMPFSLWWILLALNKAIVRTVSSLESYGLSNAQHWRICITEKICLGQRVEIYSVHLCHLSPKNCGLSVSGDYIKKESIVLSDYPLTEEL
ncbi:hypothetical protein CQW23_12903 [Capsicum baccatum]|uniref:valine--tRNA ligase n=1 Tax=Capsicum baccatum TaxID=33114 RepID=A0A2G2WTY2_CAPBA|nr:hypothetical protein CQW23_12903 [Capsicum baccatum]